MNETDCVEEDIKYGASKCSEVAAPCNMWVQSVALVYMLCLKRSENE